jgi:hypothetical protein
MTYHVSVLDVLKVDHAASIMLGHLVWENTEEDKNSRESGEHWWSRRFIRLVEYTREKEPQT